MSWKEAKENLEDAWPFMVALSVVGLGLISVIFSIVIVVASAIKVGIWIIQW